MFQINSLYQSQNFNSRIRHLILHYTAGVFPSDIKILLGGKVSSHYLVADKYYPKYMMFAVNPEYQTNEKSIIFQLVPEEQKAWHAGISYWNKVNNLNYSSIGIEIVNLDGNIHPYPIEQIEAVIWLAKKIVAKYNIAPQNVIGHSDIAPGRKIDPGTLFPWQELYNNGLGAWPNDEDIQEYINLKLPIPTELQQALSTYGYKVAITKQWDQQTIDAICAFCRHFNPNFIPNNFIPNNSCNIKQGKLEQNRLLDHKTYAILMALIKKYITTKEVQEL